MMATMAGRRRSRARRRRRPAPGGRRGRDRRAPEPRGDRLGRRARRAARAAGPAARLVLPADLQRRAAAAHRPDHGLLGHQRRATTPSDGNAVRSLIQKQAHLRGRRPGRVLGLPAAAGAHLPGARPAAAHRRVRCSGRSTCWAGWPRPAYPAGRRSSGPIRRPRSCGCTSAASRSSRPSWPSSRLVVWGADVLVRKGARLGCVARAVHAAVPGGRRCCFVLVGYNDLGTMLCLLALFVGLLWAAGVRLRVFGGMVGRRGRLGVLALILPAPATKPTTGWPGSTVFLNPPDSTQRERRRYQFLRGPVRDRQRRLVRRRAGRGPPEVGLAAQRRTTTSSSPSSPRSWAWSAASSCSRSSRVLAYTGLRIARRVERPVPPARRRRRSPPGSSARPIINIGGVVGLHADHRPAAAVHLRRRQRAGGDPGADRHAGLVRPRRARRGPSPARPSAAPSGSDYSGRRCRRCRAHARAPPTVPAPSERARRVAPGRRRASPGGPEERRR